MKATIELELKPFNVPNYVLTAQKVGERQDGFTETPVYKLEDLDVETLEPLCNEFRDSVFKKANKDQPTRSNT